MLLLSIDGMHALDFANYAMGLNGVIGGTPRSTGVWYDVSYDRALSPPDACPGTLGTQAVYDEQIDRDLTELNGGGGINPALLTGRWRSPTGRSQN